MLNSQDKRWLQDSFATKRDLRILDTKLATKLDAIYELTQENAAEKQRLNDELAAHQSAHHRYDRWFSKIAAKLGITLDS